MSFICRCAHCEGTFEDESEWGVTEDEPEGPRATSDEPAESEAEASGHEGG